MKKGMLLVLLVGIFMIGVVSAVQCDDNQTIMRLYQDSNSHVSMWNVNNDTYLEEICYDKIFGVPYSGADPHVCTGTNRILSLFADNNSHAAKDWDAVNYKHDVCYGNLVCAYDDSVGDSCVNGGEVVVRMYSGTNSHVANASYTTYDKKICCVDSPTQVLYWADANGVEITQADEVNIGDTIQAVVTGAGDIGTFTVWEDDFIDDDNITTIIDDDADGKVFGRWKITQADLDKTLGLDSFYFKTSVTGDDNSSYINISKSYDDSPMNITVVAPNCGANFSAGSKHEIVVSASDEDDFIDGTVTVNGVEVATFSNEEIRFNHTFSSSDTQIVANAVNSRGKRARHIINVMVLSGEGVYVAACIKEPKDFSDLEDSVVTFDATTTRAIEVIGGVETSISPTVLTYRDRFSWYWRWMPENEVYEFTNSNDSLAYNFTEEFPIAGGNSASLRVEFE